MAAESFAFHSLRGASMSARFVLAALALPCCEQTLLSLWPVGLAVLQEVGFLVLQSGTKPAFLGL